MKKLILSLILVTAAFRIEPTKFTSTTSSIKPESPNEIRNLLDEILQNPDKYIYSQLAGYIIGDDLQKPLVAITYNPASKVPSFFITKQLYKNIKESSEIYATLVKCYGAEDVELCDIELPRELLNGIAYKDNGRAYFISQKISCLGDVYLEKFKRCEAATLSSLVKLRK